MLKKIFSIFLCFLSIFLTEKITADDKVSIKILTREKGEINKLVYGSSILGWREDSERRLKGNTRTGGDYGYGIWDPDRRKSVEEVKKLALDAGIKIFRFIGMWHNWTEAIDIPDHQRKFRFGVDEQMMVCSEMGAEAIICISYIFDNAKEAAEIVRYLNGTADDKLVEEIEAKGLPVGKTDKERLLEQYVKNNTGITRWANLRALGGHTQPYQVRYFEIGNETWVLGTAEKYAKVYLQYYDQIKNIDPAVKIGAVFYTREWNEKLLSIVKNKIDFGIIHIYPTPVWGERLSAMSEKDIFNYSFILPYFEWDRYFKDASILLEKYAEKKVPIAVTEFNGGFVQERPVPYRHCLGTALLNAELLKIFMKPENNVLMANCWNFINEYWGMIANGAGGRIGGLNAPYYKRPNFYTFELYNKHFGDILLDVNVEAGRYAYDISIHKPIKALLGRVGAGTTVGGNLLEERWQKKDFAGVDVKETAGTLEINFVNPTQFNYYHCGKRAVVEPNTYYKLSGYVKTENLIDNQGVCLEIQDSRGWTKTQSSAAMPKTTGTIDWKYLEVGYKTLPDANSVNVIARRQGSSGPLRGGVLFKDVRLEKIVPSFQTNMPYLSVNASKSKDENKIYLMVINKNLDKSIPAVIDLKGFFPVGKAGIWILNGPSVDATNEENPDNVKVKQTAIEIQNNIFEFIFEPHSLTAIEIEKVMN